MVCQCIDERRYILCPPTLFDRVYVLVMVIRIHESVDILRDDGDVVVFYVLSK